jgi:hypothetical protein
MELYHITKIVYLDNILQNGLLVNSNKNGFVEKSHISEYHKKYGLQPIFLTNDINYIVKTQLTDSFVKDCVVLTVNTDMLNVECEFEYLNDNWMLYYTSKQGMIRDISKHKGKTFICRENIEPKHIEIVNVDFN